MMRPCLCSIGGGFQAKERAVELTEEMTKFVGGAVGAKEISENSYSESEG